MKAIKRRYFGVTKQKEEHNRMPKVSRLLLTLVLALTILLCFTACAVTAPVEVPQATTPQATTSSPAETAEPTATPLPDPAATAEPQTTPFSFAWMSDTQEYTANNNAIFCGMTQWIADTEAEYSTVLTIHTGDIIRGSYKDYQWANMRTAFALLPADMKILTVGGNHDLESYWDQYTPYLDNRPDTDFDQKHAFDDEGYVYYMTFEAGGVPFIIFSVSYGLEREAVDWINAVCKEYSDHYAILCFHSYLDPGGYSSVGKRLLGSVVAVSPNVHMVLCGHEPGAVYFPMDFDDNGDGTIDRTVFQMMFNLQHEENGGGGYLRLLRFDPVKDTIEVITYSPFLDKYGYNLSGGDDFGESKLLENAGLSAFAN